MPAARIALLITLLLLSPAAATDSKPKAAVFPLGGSADADLRDRIGFALRAKLDREGTYDVIDGPTMSDLASAAAAPITFDTPSAQVIALAKDQAPRLLIWGQVDSTPQGNRIHVHGLDTSTPDAKPIDAEAMIVHPTDMRFATEHLLETVARLPSFEHPSESPITNDPAAAALWQKNPNLLPDGDFESGGGGWKALLRDQIYTPPNSDEPPEPDRVVVLKTRQGHVLAMNLSKDVAESNGLACLSDVIPIQPHVRYRLQFRYQSDGPSLHVFVKGYTRVNGQELECYRRQVPPSAATAGQWVTITDDLNPQHVPEPVRTLRVDLYAYLKSGTVEFDDVLLKAVGQQTHTAHDPAIVSPTTNP